MKKILFCALIAILSSGAPKAFSSEEKVVAEFNERSLTDNWQIVSSNPERNNKGLQVSYVDDDAIGDVGGRAIRLDYNIGFSQKDAAFSYELASPVDAPSYNAFSFYVKANKSDFSTPLRLKAGFLWVPDGETNRRANSANFLIFNIKDQWQKITVPFKDFKNFGNKADEKKNLLYFEILFDDYNPSPRTANIGAVSIDRLAFLKLSDDEMKSVEEDRGKSIDESNKRDHETTEREAAFEKNRSSRGKSARLLIADFKKNIKPNNIEGNFGVWDKDSWDKGPADSVLGAKMSFVKDDALGDSEGYAIRLDYDVNSSDRMRSGFWMDIREAFIGTSENLNFYIKCDPKNCPNEIGVNLRIPEQDFSKEALPVSRITEQWQKVSLPLSAFNLPTLFNTPYKDYLAEFVVEFEDSHILPKKGTVFIDQISLSNPEEEARAEATDKAHQEAIKKFKLEAEEKAQREANSPEAITAKENEKARVLAEKEKVKAEEVTKLKFEEDLTQLTMEQGIIWKEVRKWKILNVRFPNDGHDPCQPRGGVYNQLHNNDAYKVKFKEYKQKDYYKDVEVLKKKGFIKEGDMEGGGGRCLEALK